MTGQTIIEADAPARPIGLAMRRGFACRCPKCGEGRLYRAYLKVVDVCPACGEELYHQRADDAPPYITILIVGHICVGGALAVEELWPHSPLWLGSIGWSVLAMILCLLLLPRIKGALVGYQWALRMHGFGGPDKDEP